MAEHSFALHEGELKKGETRVKYSVVPFSWFVYTLYNISFFILIFCHIFLKWLRSILQQPHTFQIIAARTF